MRVHTSSERGAGTDAGVYVVLYGRGGEEEEEEEDDGDSDYDDDYNSDDICSSKSHSNGKLGSRCNGRRGSGVEGRKMSLVKSTSSVKFEDERRGRRGRGRRGRGRRRKLFKKTKDIALHHDDNPFETGKIDEFSLAVEKVGQPIKMRVWHDGGGAFAAWKLDKVAGRLVEDWWL